jgi:hypothetical protein
MTRVLTYNCDICRAEMKDSYYAGAQYWIERTDTTELRHTNRGGVTHLELCSKCYDDIVNFIRSKIK